jgi:hypothetical protein
VQGLQAELQRQHLAAAVVKHAPTLVKLSKHFSAAVHQRALVDFQHQEHHHHPPQPPPEQN